jgi:multiple sugar transport system ATP-binding protein
VVNDLPPKDRDIAMVFQNYALYPHMTVADNLAFGLKLRHTPKAEIKRRVGEAAEMLGLEPDLNRKPPRCRAGSGSEWRWARPRLTVWVPPVGRNLRAIR